MGKTYVVFVGRNPGVYSTWEETHMQINKFSGAVHKSYKTREEAITEFTAYKEKQATNFTRSENKPSSSTSGSSSISASSSMKPDQSEMLAKLMDMQLQLANEHHNHCLKVAGIFEEIEQQIKSFRVRDDLK